MGKLSLEDHEETFFLVIKEGERVLGRASMGAAELREAAAKFRMAALQLEARQAPPGGGVQLLPSPASRAFSF